MRDYNNRRCATITSLGKEPIAMIHELRTYTFHVGKLPQYLKLAEEVGRPVRGDDYGVNLGYWTTEFGTLNQIWHLWRYEDLAERTALRAKLAQNQAWKNDYVANIVGLIKKQEIRFLNPVVEFKPPEGSGNIYELRHYQVQTGRAAAWLDNFKAVMPVREKYSKNVCIWGGEAPFPNNVTHMWAYSDLAQRASIRAELAKDPDWRAFLAKAGGDLVEMTSIVLTPTNYSPLQ